MTSINPAVTPKPVFDGFTNGDPDSIPITTPRFPQSSNSDEAPPTADEERDRFLEENVMPEELTEEDLVSMQEGHISADDSDILEETDIFEELDDEDDIDPGEIDDEDEDSYQAGSGHEDYDDDEAEDASLAHPDENGKQPT